MALRVEHLMLGVEEMRAGLSMGQLDTLKTVLLDQIARVDEAKVGELTQKEYYTGLFCTRRHSLCSTE